MLLGEYEHTLDDKNRLTLPAKFRQAFEGAVVVSRDVGRERDGLASVILDHRDRLLGEIKRAIHHDDPGARPRKQNRGRTPIADAGARRTAGRSPSR